VFAAGDTDWVDAVPRVVVSAEHVELVPEYHWYVYGEVPPDGLAVSVMDWPESITGDAGVIAPATKAGLTVTVTVFVAVTPRESVTWTQ
jgi:hypothetical protein